MESRDDLRRTIGLALAGVMAVGCSGGTNERMGRYRASLVSATEFKLKSPSPTTITGFGIAMARDGDTLAVGEPAASALIGFKSVVRIYTRSSQGWVLSATVAPTTPSTPNYFGSAVALEGNTLVVGASGEGPQSGQGPYVGVVYVFRRQNGVWVQEGRFWASDPGTYNSFGAHVALRGDTVFVGASGHDHQFSPTDPPEDSTGAVYVFSRTLGPGGWAWSQVKELLPNDAHRLQSFGSGLAYDGQHLVVGASGDDSLGLGSSNGAAYVFTGSGAVWTQRAKLTAGDASSVNGVSFGEVVAVDGTTLVAGATGDSEGGSLARGAAYVFSGSGGQWSQQAKLKGSGAGAKALFGYSVSVSQGVVLVGGLPTETPPAVAGAAYLFTRSGSIWTEALKLEASDKFINQDFGKTVLLHGSEAFIWAPDNRGNPPPNADEAVYIYTLSGLPGPDGGVAADGGGGVRDASIALDRSVDRGIDAPVAVPDQGIDARMPDARVPDTRLPDAQAPDARVPDARGPDARVPDARVPDSRVPDARRPDSAAVTPDATTRDAFGAIDAARRDLTAPDGPRRDSLAPSADAPADRGAGRDATRADGGQRLDGPLVADGALLDSQVGQDGYAQKDVRVSAADGGPDAGGPTADASPSHPADGGAGCSSGCGVAQSPTAMSFAWLVVLGLAYRRRRTRLTGGRRELCGRCPLEAQRPGTSSVRSFPRSFQPVLSNQVRGSRTGGSPSGGTGARSFHPLK
ncbi:MAG: hypothetical protein IT371_06030 [Deltaproteobacteria bacterium]|nr:hypothetical protein [Deltaproteobacteria bacterium]